jgi:type III secretory pathway component EscT
VNLRRVQGGIIEALLTELDGGRGTLLGWAVAWARVLPALFVVPAFGLGLLPASLRAAMALAFAVSVAPALHPSGVQLAAPWPAVLFAEALRGVPIALSAAVALWVASVAGGVADTAGRATRLGAIDGPAERATPLSTLFGLLAAVVFLSNGSAARLVARLSEAGPFTSTAVGRAAFDVATGIGLGASIGAPILVAALCMDVAIGVVARERSALSFDALYPPLRTALVLIATAALLDRMLEAVFLLSPAAAP